MQFNYIKPNEIYSLIFEWLTTKSFGGYTTESQFKNFQKNLWKPILKTIDELSVKSDLTNIEKEFLNSVIYRGSIFRILNYNPRAKKYIYLMDEYQSWSRSVKGLSEIPGIHGDKLLIIGKASYGIDIFKLLCFLIKYRYIQDPGGFNSFQRLRPYTLEEEVVYKTNIDEIEKVIVVNSKNLSNYEKNIIREIPKELIGRNTLY